MITRIVPFSLIVPALICSAAEKEAPGNYLIGADDLLIIRAPDVDEFGKDMPPARVDRSGIINLPIVGRLEVGGRTVSEAEMLLAERLREWINNPQPTIFVTEFHSQPVSVMGAVRQPGVVQVQGRKTLFEVISIAQGLSPDAGNTINITRRKEFGAIPLPGATDDSTGQFSVASVSLKSVMEAKSPQENILVQPNDVILVPKADLVYVVGSVKHSGGFALSERENITVLQALSMAEGLDSNAAPKRARILRGSGTSSRTELRVNLKAILQGKSPDVSLVPNDILFIPNNTAKDMAQRGAEAAISVATGVIIWRL